LEDFKYNDFGMHTFKWVALIQNQRINVFFRKEFKDLKDLVFLVKIIAVLLASMSLGNWFAEEVKKAKKKGDPPYKAYASIPGMIILALIILLPIAAWWLQHKP